MDRTTASIRVFDLSGALIQEIGREGQGPGEFRFINHVSVSRDTVYVADRALGRVTLLDPSGRHLDQVQLPQEFSGRAQVAGVFSDGDMLLERPGLGSRVVSQAGPLPPDSVAWYRVSRDSEDVTLLATAVAMEVYGHPWAGNFAMGQVIFGSRAHATLDGDTLLLARGSEFFDVDLVDRDGTLASWFGRELLPRETTTADRDQYVQWRLDNAPSNADTEAWRRVFDDAPMRRTFPATGGVLIDEAKNAWVQYFERLGSAQEWAVFDPKRRWLGDVDMPPGVHLLEVRAGHILASHRDDLRVETLVVYGLDKSGGSLEPH